MMGPMWLFLLMCVFHDVRHVEFLELMGSQRTPRFWGVTVGELPSTRRTVLVLYFRGTTMIFCPRQCMSPSVMDNWRVG